MQGRNSFVIVLIAATLGLLVLLQFFWLRSVYNDAASDFRKETSAIFRNTIFAMHDTLILRSIEPLRGDSSQVTFQQKRFSIRRRSTGPEPRGTDSIKALPGIRSENLEVLVTTGKDDSLGRVLRPLVNRIQSDRQQKSFVLRLGGDSLRLDSIRKTLTSNFREAGIDVDFQIHAFSRERFEDMHRTIAADYTTEPVPINPLQQYSVSFSGVHSRLLREMTPQILFSVFLTLLTISAFYIMFRNLRSQQKLMDLKNEFISNVTHELKTPVATVSVALEALKNFNALNDQQRTSEYLEIAQSELKRLTLMTEKILKTSVFEKQGVDLKIGPVDLALMLKEVLESMKLVFEKKQIKAEYHTDGQSFLVEGSEEHLRTVLYNLIDNAIKYSGEKTSIAVRLHETASNVSVAISDMGIGISPEYHKKIFEKFFRVPSGDVHNTKGYGLGLSYVASVIESHHGDISVSSEEGEGSTFTILLPKVYGH